MKMENKRRLALDASIAKSKRFAAKEVELLVAIAKQFGGVVDSRFHGDLELFKRYYAAMLRLAAKANKSRDLDSEQARKLDIMKKQFRKWFELGKVRFSIYDPETKKMKRVPLANIKAALRQKGVKVVGHGRHLKRNEHWRNFFLPIFSRVEEVYKLYKEIALAESKNK